LAKIPRKVPPTFAAGVHFPCSRAGISDAKCARGWMVGNNGVSSRWHNGSGGSTTIMVQTGTGLCWVALANNRTQPHDEIEPP
jgi:hypothetical protein